LICTVTIYLLESYGILYILSDIGKDLMGRSPKALKPKHRINCRNNQIRVYLKKLKVVGSLVQIVEDCPTKYKTVVTGVGCGNIDLLMLIFWKHKFSTFPLGWSDFAWKGALESDIRGSRFASELARCTFSLVVNFPLTFLQNTTTGL
jgi:hypothetical protein